MGRIKNCLSFIIVSTSIQFAHCSEFYAVSDYNHFNDAPPKSSRTRIGDKLSAAPVAETAPSQADIANIPAEVKAAIKDYAQKLDPSGSKQADLVKAGENAFRMTQDGPTFSKEASQKGWEFSHAQYEKDSSVFAERGGGPYPRDFNLWGFTEFAKSEMDKAINPNAAEKAATTAVAETNKPATESTNTNTAHTETASAPHTESAEKSTPAPSTSTASTANQAPQENKTLSSSPSEHTAAAPVAANPSAATTPPPSMNDLTTAIDKLKADMTATCNGITCSRSEMNSSLKAISDAQSALTKNPGDTNAMNSLKTAMTNLEKSQGNLMNNTQHAQSVTNDLSIIQGEFTKLGISGLQPLDAKNNGPTQTNSSFVGPPVPVAGNTK